jgi:hypothetical protein
LDVIGAFWFQPLKACGVFGDGTGLGYREK